MEGAKVNYRYLTVGADEYAFTSRGTWKKLRSLNVNWGGIFSSADLSISSNYKKKWI